jgi:class 3 adenylate cyclase/tetratricopeptide (TPR) repeat protein
MQCPQCQHANREGRRFCAKCGVALAAACSSCGFTNEPGDEFCGGCGARLGASPPPPSRLTTPAPDAYTPKHLAERILTSKTALEGERKQVTVLFADLKGSMELLADRDPEEARKLLDPVLERMMEAVHRYEGTVNQVMGDGIMALFGAPLSHEDHAVRACYAALRMQEAVKRYAEEVHRTAGIPLHIRVGLNSGEVVVRSIGSDLHMDYTAVGQTTHLAARMEQMAMPGAILISAETLQLAEGYVVVKALGTRSIKGLPAPVEVYEVVGAATVRSRLQATAARGLTPFVGRDAELDQLRQALERAGSGRGQVVAVVGEPGVGKSRLFWEFTHSYRLDGWLLVESTSVSYGKATAFLPILDLLRAYFQIEPRDDGRKIREKVTGKLLSLDRALEPSLPALLWLLEAPVDDPLWQRLDPPQRRQQALDGVKRLLLRESQVQPLLVVFEDLHWIDAETQTLLDSLVESLPTVRLLLLVNYRPEYQHAWAGKSFYRQIRIDPLPPESAEALLEALLGSDPALQALKALLIARTEGNPFFLEESVRTLVETKALAGERGAYQLAKTSQTLQIPATAQAILAARIDRLLPEDKRLLQAASVIGKDVPFTLLQAVSEGPEETLRRGLANLQAAEFLYEARLFPDLEYTFKHALTHDVAYGSLLQDRRRPLHARIVETIERLHRDRLTEHVERLAEHAFKGEVWDKAVTYLRQAGAKALARSANREAVIFLEQALMALPNLPETRETREQSIDLRFELRGTLFQLGEHERGFGHLRDAEGLARALDDPRRLARVSIATSHHLLVAGNAEDARLAGQRAHDIAQRLGDLALQVGANLYLGTACVCLGEIPRGQEYLERTFRLLDGDLVRERFGLHGFPAAIARSYLTWALAERGDFQAAIARGHESVEIADAVQHKYSLGFACWGLGLAYVLQGDLEQGARVAERAVALCQDWNLPSLGSFVSGVLGLARARLGRAAEAVLLLREALTSTERLGSKGIVGALMLTWLSEALLLSGRLDEARSVAEQALARTREFKHRVFEPWALRLLGEIAAHHDPPDVDAADAAYRQALALAESFEMRPLVAHCHLGLGTLYRRTGQNQQAREHLTTATKMYREMRMDSWLERAETESRTPA